MGVPSVTAGLTRSAAIAVENEESDARQQCSDSSDDARDADNRQNRGQDEGCDAHKNEQDTDNYKNLPLSV